MGMMFKLKMVIFRKKEQVTLSEGVNKEFMDILNNVIREHEKSFKGLMNGKWMKSSTLQQTK